MDPVSIALGVAPLCFSAVKGTKFLKKKISLLHGYSREVGRFRKRFRTQAGIFLDEAQLLFQDVGGLHDDAIEDFMGGTAALDPQTSHEIEEKMRSHFGPRRYEALNEAMKDIAEHMSILEETVDHIDHRDASDKGKGKVRIASLLSYPGYIPPL